MRIHYGMLALGMITAGVSTQALATDFASKSYTLHLSDGATTSVQAPRGTHWEQVVGSPSKVATARIVGDVVEVQALHPGHTDMLFVHHRAHSPSVAQRYTLVVG